MSKLPKCGASPPQAPAQRDINPCTRNCQPQRLQIDPEHSATQEADPCRAKPAQAGPLAEHQWRTHLSYHVVHGVCYCKGPYALPVTLALVSCDPAPGCVRFHNIRKRSHTRPSTLAEDSLGFPNTDKKHVTGTIARAFPRAFTAHNITASIPRAGIVPCHPDQAIERLSGGGGQANRAAEVVRDLFVPVDNDALESRLGHRAMRRVDVNCTIMCGCQTRFTCFASIAKAFPRTKPFQ